MLHSHYQLLGRQRKGADVVGGEKGIEGGENKDGQMRIKAVLISTTSWQRQAHGIIARERQAGGGEGKSPHL